MAADLIGNPSVFCVVSHGADFSALDTGENKMV